MRDTQILCIVINHIVQSFHICVGFAMGTEFLSIFGLSGGLKLLLTGKEKLSGLLIGHFGIVRTSMERVRDLGLREMVLRG